MIWGGYGPCVVFVFLLLGGCIASGAPEQIQGSAWLATQYNNRGMPQNERGVGQLEGVVDFPTMVGGTFRTRAWGNIDLQNDVGDAWFGDGNGGKFTEVDLSGSYHELYRTFDFGFGVTSYVLPDAAFFPNGPRGSTTETFLSVGRDVRGFYPLLVLHYDFDEVDGLYANAGVSRSFGLGEKLALEGNLSLGYSDEDHSLWTYGLEESGLADLRGTASASYLSSEHTTIVLEFAASTILDSAIEDWMDDVLEIESNNVWASLGIAWGL